MGHVASNCYQKHSYFDKQFFPHYFATFTFILNALKIPLFCYLNLLSPDTNTNCLSFFQTAYGTSPPPHLDSHLSRTQFLALFSPSFNKQQSMQRQMRQSDTRSDLKPRPFCIHKQNFYLEQNEFSYHFYPKQ